MSGHDHCDWSSRNNSLERHHNGPASRLNFGWGRKKEHAAQVLERQLLVARTRDARRNDGSTVIAARLPTVEYPSLTSMHGDASGFGGFHTLFRSLVFRTGFCWLYSLISRRSWRASTMRWSCTLPRWTSSALRPRRKTLLTSPTSARRGAWPTIRKCCWFLTVEYSGGFLSTVSMVWDQTSSMVTLLSTSFFLGQTLVFRHTFLSLCYCFFFLVDTP